MDDEKHEVRYLYRDAGNSKFRGSFVVRGRFEVEALRPYLFDREWFVPERVGLPALRPSETTKDDHWLHEFEQVTPYSGPQDGISASELTRRIREVGERDGWFEAAWPRA
jgi:hypothetical protein